MVRFKIARRRTSLGAKAFVFLESVEHLDSSIPLWVNGSAYPITAVVGCKVILASCVNAKAQDTDVCQYHYLVSPQDMHAEGFSVMNQWWQRDPQHAGNWEEDGEDTMQAVRFLADVPRHHALVVGPLAPSDWEAGVSKRSNSSSRGKCAFSPWELKVMPPALVNIFLMILNAIEEGLSWPALWIDTFTACISKCDDAQSILDIRPITIFSVVYRTWAKARATQVALWASAFMPRNVICGLPGAGPADIWGLSLD